MFRFFILFVLAVSQIALYAEDKIEVGIEHEKKLGTYLPLELEFTNSDGKLLKLSDIITKPTVLDLVYYNCPGICSPLLTSLSEVVDKTDLQSGTDYQLLTISFDPSETYDVASRWKHNYVSSLSSDFDSTSWYFMVGDSLNIAKITDAVGFRYLPDGDDDFMHAGALIMISPDGKITRYLLGTSYLPFDFKMAILEASKGIANPPIAKLLAYCFSYDPAGNKYVFEFNKIAGTAIFLGVGVLFLVLLVKGRKKTNTGDMNE